MFKVPWYKVKLKVPNYARLRRVPNKARQRRVQAPKGRQTRGETNGPRSGGPNGTAECATSPGNVPHPLGTLVLSPQALVS